MRLLHLVAVTLSLACFLEADTLLARGPSTREERARVIEVAARLERDPLNPTSQSDGQWVRDWAIAVPDVRVAVCLDILRPEIDSTYAYHDVLNRQMWASAAAFSVQHPEKSRDDLAMYRAGVEGALRAYEALLRARSDARSPFLDDLRAKRDRGELASEVRELATKCTRGPDLQLVAFLAGMGAGIALALLVGWRFVPARPVAWGPDTVRRAARLERIVIGSVLYYLVVAAALHWLEPDFDPRYRFMSEYVWGAHGWLMVTTFFALATAAVTVALALRHLYGCTRSARFGFGLLIVGAVFVCLAGIFKDFLPHLLASAVAIPSLLMAVLIYSWSFRTAAEWKAVYPLGISIAAVMLILFLCMMTGLGMPGLEQRGFLFLLLMWLAMVAGRSTRVVRKKLGPQPGI